MSAIIVRFTNAFLNLPEANWRRWYRTKKTYSLRFDYLSDDELEAIHAHLMCWKLEGYIDYHIRVADIGWCAFVYVWLTCEPKVAKDMLQSYPV